MPDFWHLMTAWERIAWSSPDRALITRGVITRRFVYAKTLGTWRRTHYSEATPADNPAFAKPAPGHHTRDDHPGAPKRVNTDLRNRKPLKGYAFPDRPVMPVEMAVFDDYQAARAKLYYGLVSARFALGFGLGMMAMALWRLAE